MKPKDNCPCTSGKSYFECCGIAHTNINDVKTAEQLMRSRYSAFALANSEYLHLSHHSSTRPKSPRERKATIAWAKSVTWTGLQIIETQKGGESDNEGIVEFKALFLENGKMDIIHERSTFVKQNGHWVYYGAVRR